MTAIHICNAYSLMLSPKVTNPAFDFPFDYAQGDVAQGDGLLHFDFMYWMSHLLNNVAYWSILITTPSFGHFSFFLNLYPYLNFQTIVIPKFT